MPDAAAPSPTPVPAHGVPAHDRVRAALAAALARRAGAHAGAAREAIEAKLAALQPGVVEVVADEAGEGVSTAHAAHAARGPLADLVADAARQKPLPVLGAAGRPREAAPATAGSAPAPASSPAGRTLQFFKQTWSRLSAEQRLAQSRATLPDNAGPLNSHHLVHRALTLMQSLSPEYLEHFVGYVDALQWLEQANEAAAAEPRSTAPRRSAALRR